MMLKRRGSIIAALDIGSSKIICLIAKSLGNGKFEIIGIGHNASHGIRSGVVTDIKMLEHSIIHAVESAESASGEKIKKINVSISSNIVLSQRFYSELSILGREVNYKDINKLLFEALERYNQRALEILHTFTCNYMIDGHKGITNPLGLHGDKLGCDLHVITVPTNNLLNFNSCLSKCGLHINSYVASTYASSLACLTEDEIELGVICIEFGAGSTSIALFEKGQIIHIDGVPFGGINVTNDIAKCLCMNFTEAERLKNLYGGVIATDSDTNEMLEINHGDDNLISRALLIDIIRTRINEILEMIEEKLRASNLHIHGKVVMTGGAARMPGLKELLSHNFGTKVRIGSPVYNLDFVESSSTLEFVTALGIIDYVINNTEHNKSGQNDDKSTKMSKVLKWLKSYFQH